MKNIFLSQILAIALSLLLSQQAYANFTYEGHLTSLIDVPVTNQPATIKVSILGPTGTCIIFQETHSVITNDKGFFSIQVGGGFTTSSGSIFDGVFKNDLSIVTVTAPVACSYTSAVGDNRRMQIEVSTDAGATYDNLGMIALGKAPQATHADTVGGFDATKLFRVAADATAPTLSLAQVTEFNALIAGNSTRYVPAAGNTSNISAPTVIAGTGGTGSSTSPAYSFSGDTTTGIFHPSAGVLGFATGGFERMTIATNASGDATLNVNGHIGSSGPSASLLTCTGGTLEPASNDTRGRVSFSSTGGTTCVINFAKAFNSTPFCVVSWQGALIPALGISASEFTTQLQIKFSAAPTIGNAFNYHCLQ